MKMFFVLFYVLAGWEMWEWLNVFENFLQLFNFLVHKMSEMWLTGTTVSGSLSQNKEGHLKTNVGSTAMTTNNQDELKNEKVNAE